LALLREFPRQAAACSAPWSWKHPVDGRHMAWEVALPEENMGSNLLAMLRRRR